MRRVASGPVTKSQGRVELRQNVHDWQRASHVRGSRDGTTNPGTLPPLQEKQSTDVVLSATPDVCNGVVEDIARRRGSDPTWLASPAERRVAHSREAKQSRRTPAAPASLADSSWHPDVAVDWRARTTSGHHPWSSDPACDMRLQRLTLEFDQERSWLVEQSAELREELCSMKARQEVLSQLADRRWQENKEMVEALSEAEAVSENAESNFGFYQFLTDQKVLNAVRRCQDSERAMEETLRSELDACSELARATKGALDEAVEAERNHGEVEQSLRNAEARLALEVTDNHSMYMKELDQAATQSACEIASLKTAKTEMVVLVAEMRQEVSTRDEELRQMKIAQMQQRSLFDKRTAEVAEIASRASVDAWEQAKSEERRAEKQFERFGLEHVEVIKEIQKRSNAEVSEMRAAACATAHRASTAVATCLHFEKCEQSAEAFAARQAEKLDNARAEISAAQVALKTSAAVESSLREELDEVRSRSAVCPPAKKSWTAAEFQEEIEAARTDASKQARVAQDLREELRDALCLASQSSAEVCSVKDELKAAENASQNALRLIQWQLDEAKAESSSLRDEMQYAEASQISERQQNDAGDAALQLLELVAEVQDLTFVSKTCK
mmetsp:Transcript_31595/g.75740  ORF Transcript_31595/g.75740 Transcript_31595/m.75740 type:complete len:616 (+) Transcript_31595:52-1899(+)